MLKTRFGLWDGAACAAVLLLALALFLGIGAAAKGDTLVVTVSVDGKTVLEKPLMGTEGRFPIAGEYPLTLVISGGKVWVEDATCPGHDCQRQGAVSQAGQTVVCLPGRVTVAVAGGSGADVTVG